MVAGRSAWWADDGLCVDYGNGRWLRVKGYFRGAPNDADVVKVAENVAIDDGDVAWIGSGP